MDVRISLSVSLLRDQLRAVIEQAVTNAVETVLGEMLKVVGCKFEEFGKEMTAKERENESIRKMLEISRCQMKTMRKYLSAVSSKDERQVPVNHKLGKQSEPNRTPCPYGGELQPLSNINRTSKEGDGNLNFNGRTVRQIASLSDGLAGATQLLDVTSIKNQELAVRESQDPNVHQKEHLTHVKEEHRDPPEVSGRCHSREGTCETELSHGGSAEILNFDNPSLHEPDVIAAANTGASPQTKKEEAEMQLICIKEESLEMEMHTLSPHQPDPSHEQGGGWDRAGPVAGPAGAALAAISSSTYWAGLQRETSEWQAEMQQRQRAELQQQRADLQQQHRVELQQRQRGKLQQQHRVELHQQRAELLQQRAELQQQHRAELHQQRVELHQLRPELQQQHRAELQQRQRAELQQQHRAELHQQRAELQQQRAELKRRSQLHRRERERSLPQPLQAALERERREKTRIRVARWRAKRKLQAAGLAVSQPRQQTTRTHADDPLQHHQQYASLLYSGPHCHNSTLYPPLRVEQELTDTLAQPEAMAVQQGILGIDSELFL